MRQAGAGEDGQLLSTDQGVQAVNGRNTGLDKLGRIVAGHGVERKAVDIHSLVGNDGGAIVNGVAHSGENAAQHVLGDGQVKASSQETDFGRAQVQARSSVKELNEDVISIDLQNLAATDFTVFQLNLAELIICNVLYLFDQHQRTGDLLNGSVFSGH